MFDLICGWGARAYLIFIAFSVIMAMRQEASAITRTITTWEYFKDFVWRIPKNRHRFILAITIWAILMVAAWCEPIITIL